MNKLIILGIIGIVGAVTVKNETGLPTAKITIQVVDEDNKPIQGATAAASFEKGKPVWGGGDVDTKTGLTDANGNFSASGPSLDTKGGEVQKEGYYTGWTSGAHFTSVSLGHWQPWNPTVTVQLKKKVDPIPMYAKNVDTSIPVADKPVGYDLEVGDWVSPYGKGKVSDFVFVYSGSFIARNNYNSKVELKFSSPSDGIQSWKTKIDSDTGSSELKSGRVAPDSGYEPEIVKAASASPSGGFVDSRDEKMN